MKAIGITCGVGSMLIGARRAGFDIAGNVEWRRYYHIEDEQGRNTFIENFPGAIFPYTLDEMSDADRELFYGADIALGHPECGNFSQLNVSNRSHKMNAKDPADIPLFVDLVAEFKPRFFVMDDLPKSFAAFPMEEYARRLPDYDLFPEWVSNYAYGNVQKFRKRMFMIGALKKENYAFVPGEFEHDLTVEDVVGDLLDPCGDVPNHDVPASIGHHLGKRNHRADWREVRDYFAKHQSGQIMEYVGEDGLPRKRIGASKAYWDGHSFVLTGSNTPSIHPIKNVPFSVRERARIQGFPDDFVFYGTRHEPDGSWVHAKNSNVVKQTGKAMPIQFCEYVSRQIAAHIRGEPFETTGERVEKQNHLVDEAKRWCYRNIEYANLEAVLKNCWLQDRYVVSDPHAGIMEEPTQGELF